MIRRLGTLWAAATVVAVMLGGCAGSGADGDSRAPGDVEMKIRFDAVARNVPGYADRVRVTITLQGSSQPEPPRIVSRPGDAGGEATLRIESVPVGRHLVRVEALTPEPDSRVVALTPNVGFLVQSNRSTTLIFSNDLTSTIGTLVIDEAASLADPGIDVSQESVQLGASARNIDDPDEILLQTPGKGFRWSIGDRSVAEITEDGVLTPIGDGSTTVTVRLGTPSGEIEATTPLRITGPRGTAGLAIEWGAVTINKDVPGYIKGITAKLVRNNVEVASATFNRAGNNNAHTATVTFPGDFPFGADYELRLEGKNRDNVVIAAATLTGVVIPFDENNPRLVSTLVDTISKLVFVRSDAGSIGGDEFENGSTMNLSVNAKATLRCQARNAGNVTVLRHIDIQVESTDPSIVSVEDNSDRADVTGVAPGTAQVRGITDGGPSITITVIVN